MSEENQEVEIIGSKYTPETELVRLRLLYEELYRTWRVTLDADHRVYLYEARKSIGSKIETLLGRKLMKNNCVFLTKEEKDDIKNRFHKGETQQHIANLYGIRRCRVSKVVNN